MIHHRGFMPTLCLVCVVFSVSCSPGDLSSTSPGRSGQSHLTYNVLADEYGEDANGLMFVIKEQSMTICVTETTDQEVLDVVKATVLAWINPLKKVAGSRLAADVKVTTSNCDSANATVIVYSSDGRSYMQPGRHPELNIYQDSRGYRKVMLHEFGHGFGLGDTYLESGGCQQGQPTDTVMCMADFDDPQDDDIDGMKKIYSNLYPGETPVALGPEVYAALGQNEQPNGGYFLYAASPDSISAAGIKYCVQESAANCNASTSDWLDMNKLSLSNGANIFVTKDPGKISETAKIAFRAVSSTDAAKETFKTISFKVNIESQSSPEDPQTEEAPLLSVPSLGADVWNLPRI